ncbi:hypothetical protein ACWZJV_03220 [Nocardioides sp. WG-D5]
MLAIVVFVATFAGSLVLVAPAAQAVTFAPRVITGIPAAPRPGQTVYQKVVRLETVTEQVTAGQTAYLYSKLNAYDSAHVNLVDNEVICSGAGSGSAVMGENIDPPTGLEDRQSISIITRLLVQATSSGTMTCSIYLRTISLSPNVSSMTVSGELRFAGTDIKEDASGQPIQVAEPAGPPTTLTKELYVSKLDRTLPTDYTEVAVIADTEFQSCWPDDADGNQEPDCESSDTSVARFTLSVRLMNGSTVCASAPIARTDVAVNDQTHHKAIPLYTKVSRVAGCDRLYAYVKAEYLSGHTGGIQGTTPPLTDETPPDPTHRSWMTHAFAVPS